MKVLICSDWHCGHRVGLLHENNQPKISDGEPEPVQKVASIRRLLWNWFSKTVKTEAPFDKLIINGDAIDGSGEKCGGVDLITSDRNEQVEWAKNIVDFIGASDVRVVLGTPYHVGSEEDWEVTLARRINAKHCDPKGLYDLNGLIVDCVHKMSEAAGAWTKAQLMSYLGKLHDAAVTGKPAEKMTNLMIRSHIHRCVGYCNPAMNFQAWTTPALAWAPGTKYSRTMPDSLPRDIGLLVLHVESEKDWHIEPHICPIPNGERAK